MKNILYVGPYRQADVFGEVSREFVNALFKSKFNITIRPAYVSNAQRMVVDDKFVQAEALLDTYDTVIQHVLPNMFEYFGGLKNIGIMSPETSNIQYTGWPNRCNIMDEMWTNSELSKTRLKSSGVKVPIHVISQPSDTVKFTKPYDSILVTNPPKFLFYYIGAFESRKNIVGLLTAFHREFHINEPVELVLKFHQPGTNPHQLMEQVQQQIRRTKEVLRIYQNPDLYKQEVIITEFMPQEAIYALHNSCHCFVSASCSESWSIPSFDALGFGKTPIIVDGTGPTAFVNKKNGWVVKSVEDSIINDASPHPTLFTAHEHWNRAHTLSLGAAMRASYQLNTDERKIKSLIGQNEVKNYSYDNIASILNDHN